MKIEPAAITEHDRMLFCTAGDHFVIPTEMYMTWFKACMPVMLQIKVCVDAPEDTFVLICAIQLTIVTLTMLPFWCASALCDHPEPGL